MPITNRHIKQAVHYYLTRYFKGYSNLQGNGTIFFFLDGFGDAHRILVEKKSNHEFYLNGDILGLTFVVDHDQVYERLLGLLDYHYTPVY